jgi:hypothetical protein
MCAALTSSQDRCASLIDPGQILNGQRLGHSSEPINRVRIPGGQPTTLHLLELRRAHAAPSSLPAMATSMATNNSPLATVESDALTSPSARMET